jgi:hypothetical protein
MLTYAYTQAACSSDADLVHLSAYARSRPPGIILKTNVMMVESEQISGASDAEQEPPEAHALTQNMARNGLGGDQGSGQDRPASSRGAVRGGTSSRRDVDTRDTSARLEYVPPVSDRVEYVPTRGGGGGSGGGGGGQMPSPTETDGGDGGSGEEYARGGRGSGGRSGSNSRPISGSSSRPISATSRPKSAPRATRSTDMGCPGTEISQ